MRAAVTTAALALLAMGAGPCDGTSSSGSARVAVYWALYDEAEPAPMTVATCPRNSTIEYTIGPVGKTIACAAATPIIELPRGETFHGTATLVDQFGSPLSEAMPIEVSTVGADTTHPVDAGFTFLFKPPHGLGTVAVPTNATIEDLAPRLAVDAVDPSRVYVAGGSRVLTLQRGEPFTLVATTELPDVSIAAILAAPTGGLQVLGRFGAARAPWGARIDDPTTTLVANQFTYQGPVPFGPHVAVQTDDATFVVGGTASAPSIVITEFPVGADPHTRVFASTLAGPQVTAATRAVTDVVVATVDEAGAPRSLLARFSASSQWATLLTSPDGLAIDAVAATPDGALIVAAGYTGARAAVIALDGATGAVRWSMALDQARFEGVVVSPTGAISVLGASHDLFYSARIDPLTGRLVLPGVTAALPLPLAGPIDSLVDDDETVLYALQSSASAPTQVTRGLPDACGTVHTVDGELGELAITATAIGPLALTADSVPALDPTSVAPFRPQAQITTTCR